MTLPERDALKLLRQIEMREVFLDPHTPIPLDGYVQYDVAPIGWGICVKTRDGRWDRLDWVESPKTGKLHYAAMSQQLQAFRPTTETQRVQFGFRLVS